MMNSKIAGKLILLGAVSGVATGCASDDLDAPPARVDAPIGVQMMAVEPELKAQKFNNLLSFETDSDLVFVSGAAPDAIVQDSSRAHAGRSSIRISGGVLAVKLSSLVKEGTFPGDWTLAGAYFYSRGGTEMSISCQLGAALVAQRKLTIPPGKWTPAMVDVAQLSEMKALVDSESLSGVVFQCESTEPIWCDDFTLFNNAMILFGTETSELSLDDPWLIQRRGLNYIGAAPGRFTFKLLAADQSTIGWSPQELNAKRARFTSSGPQKSVTIYNDGRAYWDGQYRPLSANMGEPQFTAQHQQPGQVEVADDFGRLNRNTAGDADNDGYNESRGAYQIRATGHRLELSLIPRSVPLSRPVLEITGMPEGKVVVTIEGHLVDDITRLDDGTILVDIPAKINRATNVSVKVQ